MSINWDKGDMIELDVSGTYYTETTETLKDLRGIIDAAKVFKGRKFISGDGQLFKYVLDYLRDGKLDLPTNFNEHSRLRNEADRYKLDGLVNLIDKGK
jgi:hypothetical protein